MGSMRGAKSWLGISHHLGHGLAWERHPAPRMPLFVLFPVSYGGLFCAIYDIHNDDTRQRWAGQNAGVDRAVCFFLRWVGGADKEACQTKRAAYASISAYRRAIWLGWAAVQFSSLHDLGLGNGNFIGMESGVLSKGIGAGNQSTCEHSTRLPT